MKKISMVLTVVCTILVSVLFCACGNKYKNLEIKYLGKEDTIVLVMDNEYQSLFGDASSQNNKKAKEIHFEVSGIKEKLMGEIKVQVVPQDLAELSEITVNGTDIGFYIRALKSGNGNLVVTHLASGKNASIMIHIDKKAVSSTSNGNMLVVDIPNQQQLTEAEKVGLTEQEIAEKEAELNQKIFTIDADTLLNFNPIDSTDIVDWQVVDSTGANTSLAIDGVEFGDFRKVAENDQNYQVVNNQIKVESSCAGGVFYLKPILKMDGYSDLAQNVVVRVNIAKVLSQNNIEILSKNAIASNTEKLAETDTRLPNARLIKNGIKLFANSSQYSSASFALFNGQESLLDSKLYNADLVDQNSNNGLYKISVATSCSQIGVEDDVITLTKLDAGQEDKTVALKTLVGLNYSANNEWVAFKFEPQNAVGDIAPFEIKLDVNLTEIATRIDLKMDNEKVSTTVVDDNTTKTDIVLLDYYEKYNNYGQLFNFEVIKSSCDNALKQMRIKVDKNILSPKNSQTDSSMSLYFLEFRKGAQYLTFESVENENYFVSAPFKSSDRVYIKYVFNTNEDANVDTNLTFDVVNYYDGSYNELLEDGNMSKTDVLINTEKTLTVSISRGRGVKSLDLKASNVRSSEGVIEYKLTGDEFYILNSVIQNQTDILRENGTAYQLVNDKFIYGFSIANILGSSNRVLSNAEKMNIEFGFDVRNAKGEIVDIFDFYQYKQSKNNFSRLLQNKFHLDVEGEKLFNSINLIKKDNATLLDGEYVFNLYQDASGYKTSTKFYIVSNLAGEDIKITPFDQQTNSNGQYYNDYVLLETEPDDWATNYKKYYVYDTENKKYIKVADNTAPTFELNKYWTTTFAGYKGNSYILPTNNSIATQLMAGSYFGGQFVENSLLYQYITSIKTEISVTNEDGNVTEFGASSYLNYVPSTILSACRTGKINTSLFGTFLNGKRHYIHIVYKLEKNEYEINADGFYLLKTSQSVLEKPIDIFVYVPLDKAYINNNVSTTSAIVDDSNLGYYFKDLSRKEFTLNIINPYNNSQDMFDYLNFEWKELETLSGNNVSYSADNRTQFVHFIQNRNVVIMAKITQFNQEKNVICQVNVKSAVNTDDIAIRNNLMTINSTGTKYISINLGKTLKLDVDILGQGSFDELKYVVCDNAGNVLKNYVVATNGQLLNIFDKSGNPVNADQQQYLNFAQDFKVIIFAKDWLYKDVDSEYNVFNFGDLTEYLIHDKYQEKVKIVDIKIRDGSEIFPFLVSNASEFKDMAQSKELYYQLVNDINLGNIAINLGTFNGHLNSYLEYSLLASQPDDWATNFDKYYVFNAGKYEKLTANVGFAYRKYYQAIQSHFTVYNVQLGDNISNVAYNLNNKTSTLPTDTKYLALFDTLNSNATIENITFQINFGNTKIASNIKLLGVVGENLGTITNVAVEYSGTINVCNNVSKYELYIGGLVGKNAGTIIEQDPNYVYSSGNLTVERNANDKGTKIYLGGLVGLNIGKIEGVLPTTEQGIEYVLMYEEQGSLFNGEIKLVGGLDEEFKDSKYVINSAIGGVVGVNINLTNTHESNQDNQKIADRNIVILDIIKDIDTANIKGEMDSVYSSGKVEGGDVTGGMIGFNWGNGDNVTSANYTIESGEVSTNASVVNSLSTTKVIGKNYVGGFVGFDYKGVLYHAYYEVYNTYNSEQGGSSVSAEKYVGGFIGYAFQSKLNYCYFHSFRWTYVTEKNSEEISLDNSEFYYTDKDNQKHLKQADILGKQYIGGLIGYAMNNGENNQSKTVVHNSVVDAYIKASLINADSATAGIIGYSYGAPVVNNAYTQGFVEYFAGNNSGYKDVRVFAGGSEITDTLTFDKVLPRGGAEALAPALRGVAER